MNPPSALHGAMSRERKPFTYTPGGLDLSEIKSERMAKRLMRNAMNQGVPEVPIQQFQSPPMPSTPIAVPNFNCLPVQVFPTINLPANPKSLLRTRSNPDQSRNPIVQKVPTPSQNGKNIIPEKIESSMPYYSQTNNSNQIRPATMYEYNTPSSNNDTSRRLSYGTDQYTLPLLPEISYEAEFCQVPTKINNSIGNTPLSSYTESKEDNDLTSNKKLEIINGDFIIQPITDTSSIPPSLVSKPVEDEAASSDEQREVKVVKKQVKKEQKVENGEQNGDANIEADLTVKLPTKKSAAKTETKVEVNKTILPDGTVEEVKITTTKTTIDGKTEIKTKTEKRIIPKQETEDEIEEEEEEEVEEDQEEESNVVVQEVKETSNEEPKKVIKTVVKETPVVENGQKETIVKKEETSTTTTKKVVVVQKEESEEEEEEEEEIEESEPVIIKKPPTSKPVEEQEEEEEEEEIIEQSKVENKSESKVVEQEEEEEETVAVKIVKKEQTPQKPDVEEEDEEVEEEYEEAEDKEEKIEEKRVVEDKVFAKETKEVKEENEESEYTEEEYESEKEEVIKENPPKETTTTSKEDVKLEPKEEKSEIKTQIPEQLAAQLQQPSPQPEQPTSKPDQPEQKVPLREPSIPLDKVEEIEIKPIGASGDVISKSHTENTEIIKSFNQQPIGPDSSDNYQTSTQQYSSSYVPPPWEQDSSYVADTSSQNYFQPPPLSNSYTVDAKPAWQPAPSNKFAKTAPTSYIPPAPNQSFVRHVNIGAEPPKIPGRKTYYSEYERRYITVPESTYIPGETKFQPQPDPSPQYYYDNNEPTQAVEHEWRKELREFTEKTTQVQDRQTTEISVQPPWEEDPKYGKTPSAYTPTPTWSQTLRPRSWRERSFESEYVGSQEFPKTNTLGRGRPLSSYGTNVEAAIPERPRGVSVDRYNPNIYNSPIPAEHPPVQTHTLVPTPSAKSYHNPNVPGYHTHARASAEPREHSAIPQARLWGEARGTPIQSRSFKYLQWITGTED
ncbi:FK506-binding protein 5-like isoform X2 [Achroia grisella]|uniref:FK506-binding protein 5-like isoform X2 n=1 Tax=Achroia grisella TaxID=688607 RepID=UPI0027D1F526|nr:FK506-binding protein 5-like isoform X2 [Achroia grisella]